MDKELEERMAVVLDHTLTDFDDRPALDTLERMKKLDRKFRVSDPVMIHYVATLYNTSRKFYSERS
jgi:hypothetical protein